MTARKKPEDKQKVGRKSLFPLLDLRAVKLFISDGWTDEEIAKHHGISVDSLDRWKKKYPEFGGAVKDWKDEADAKVEASLYHRACGYSHDAVKIFNDNGTPLVVPYTEHYPPDPTSMIFWLKNRQKDKWRDKHEHDLNHRTISDDELEQRLAALLGKPGEPDNG